MVLNNVDNIMLGSDEVDKIYCGSNVIWKRSILPAGYTQKEYLQTNGEQVINTEYTPQTDVLQIETQLLYNSQPDKAIAQSRLFGFWTYNSQVYVYTNANSNALFSPSLSVQSNTVYTLIAKNGASQKLLQIDETQWTNDSATQVTDTNNPIYLLAGKYSNAQPISNFDYFYTGRMYYCKIYDNDILVRDFIPAVRDSDGKVGFYDLVTNQFYTNAGTGADFTTN